MRETLFFGTCASAVMPIGKRGFNIGRTDVYVPAGPMTVLFAAGGTGGHLFPALATAEILQTRGHKVCFIVDTRVKKYLDNNIDNNYVLPSSPFKIGFYSILRFIRDGIIGFGKSWLIMRQIRPCAVVGFGGYTSFFVVLAAITRRIPIIIQEQNAVLGQANTLLASCAQRIALSCENVVGNKYKNKSVVIGHPVRPSIRMIRELAYPSIEQNKVCILITGGSQGAAIFSTILPKALNLLSEQQRQKVRLIQQCRLNDIDEIREQYSALGIEAEIASFFDNMSQKIRSAHLLIGRSGASSLWEAMSAGRPIIAVPYPFAKYNHQKHNAEIITKHHTGWVIEQANFTPVNLASLVKLLLDNPQILVDYANNAKELSSEDGAHNLASLLENSFL
jgi:UDP-N-acetylglucosamine--N-acetylmuramyl-(pentapeptide) pyrophosphoryl-undecaprenol N-acetylglucosamine transferase